MVRVRLASVQNTIKLPSFNLAMDRADGSFLDSRKYCEEAGKMT